MTRNIAINNANAGTGISQLQSKYKDWTTVNHGETKFIYHKVTYSVILKKEKELSTLERIGRIALAVVTLGIPLLLSSDFRRWIFEDKKYVQIGVPNASVEKITSTYNKAQLPERLKDLENYYTVIQQADPAMPVKSITECVKNCSNREEFGKVFEFVKKHDDFSKNNDFKSENAKTLAVKIFKGDSAWLGEYSSPKELLDIAKYFEFFDNLIKLDPEAAVNACDKFLSLTTTSDDIKIKIFKFLQSVLENPETHNQKNLNKSSSLILTYLDSLPPSLRDSCELLAIKCCLRSTKRNTENTVKSNKDDIFRGIKFFFEHPDSFKDDQETKELVAQYLLYRQGIEDKFKNDEWKNKSELIALDTFLHPETKKGILTLPREQEFQILKDRFSKIDIKEKPYITSFLKDYLDYKQKTPTDCAIAINMITEQEGFFDDSLLSETAKLFVRFNRKVKDYGLSPESFKFFGDYIFSGRVTFSDDVKEQEISLVEASTYFIRSDKTTKDIKEKATLCLLEHPKAEIPKEFLITAAEYRESLISASIFAFSKDNPVSEAKYFVAATKICLEHIPPNTSKADYKAVLNDSLTYLFSHFTNEFKDEKEARELAALAVAIQKSSHANWVEMSKIIAQETIRDSDSFGIPDQNRDKILTYLEAWLPQLGETDKINSYVTRCLAEGIKYPHISRVILLIAQNENRFDQATKQAAAKLQIKLFTKVKHNILRGVKPGKDDEKTFNLFGKFIFNDIMKFEEGELLLASSFYVYWKEADPEISIKAISYLIEHASVGFPSEAVMAAASEVFVSPTSFTHACKMKTTQICLNTVSLTTPSSLNFFFSNIDSFNDDEETRAKAALYVLTQGIQSPDWNAKSVAIAQKIILQPDSDPLVFAQNCHKKMAFLEVYNPSTLSGAEKGAIGQFLLKCMAETEDVWSQQGSEAELKAATELGMKAVLFILNRNIQHVQLTPKAIELLQKIILNFGNTESEDNKKLAALAQVIFKGAKDGKPLEVLLKARRMNFWSDVTKFSSTNDLNRVSISHKLLVEFPEAVLKKFFLDCFQKNPKSQHLHVRYIDDNIWEDDIWVDLPGIDAGGLSKSFLAELFGSLKAQADSDKCNILQFRQFKGASIPGASAKTTEGKYRALTVFNYLSDEQLCEALKLANITEENAPEVLRDEYENLDLEKVRDNFEVVQSRLKLLSQQEEQLYETIGKLMGFCFTSGRHHSRNKCVIGEIFDPGVYQVICAIPKTELSKSYEQVSDDTLLKMYELITESVKMDQKRYYYLKMSADSLTAQDFNSILGEVYLDDDDRPEALRGIPYNKRPEHYALIKENFELIQNDIRSELLAEAKTNSSLAAIFKMAIGMAKHIPEVGNWGKDAKDLQESIQGSFNPEKLKESILCNDESIKSWFKDWIEENKDDVKKLKDFLLCSTGSNTLAMDTKITVLCNPDRPRDQLLELHNCFNLVNCSYYPSYEIFKQKLEQTIPNAIAAGFTLG